MFGTDGAFYKYGTKLFDLMILILISVVIIVISAGILFGPVMCSFFYTIDKVVVHERGYLLANFMKSFKENLKQGIFVGLLFIAGIIGLGYVLYMSQGVELPTLAVVGLYLGLYELVSLCLYTFVLLAKFEFATLAVLRMAFLYGHRHLLTTFVAMSLIIISVYMTVQFHPLFLLVGIGLTGVVFSRLMMVIVLPKYVDKDKLEFFE